MANTLGKEQAAIFETMPIPKAVAKLAIPTVISQLITMIYNIADTWFIGQTGDTNQVAAITIAFPLMHVLAAIASLFGIGAGSLASRALGEKNYKGVFTFTSFGCWASIGSTLLFSLIILAFSEPILTFAGADSSTLGHTFDYVLWALIIGGVPSALNIVLAHLIRVTGDSKRAGFGMSLGGVLNMVLDPIFIFPWGLGMNITGAAIATCISNVVAMAYLLRRIIKTRKTSVISIHPKYLRGSRKIAGRVILTGLPSALQTLTAAVSNTVLNGLMSAHSTSAVAAIGIVKKVDLIATYITRGIAEGVLPLLAYNYAAGNYARMKKASRFSLVTAVGMAVFFLLFYELFAEQLVGLFINDAATIELGALFLRIHCAATPLIAVTFILIVTFQSVGKSKNALFLPLFRKGIIDIPMMYWADALLPMTGIMLVQPVLDVVCTTIGLCMYVSLLRQLKTDEGAMAHEG